MRRVDVLVVAVCVAIAVPSASFAQSHGAFVEVRLVAEAERRVTSF
jgi:hypothetical protein